MKLIYDAYPYSPLACEDGIKHIIGKSLSISFCESKFNSRCEDIEETLSDSIRTKEKLKEEVSKFEKLGYKDLYYRKFNYYDIGTNANNPYYALCRTIKVIKGNRRELDNRASLLSLATKCKCFLCSKDKPNSPSEILTEEDYENVLPRCHFVFDLKDSTRSEYICSRCITKNKELILQNSKDINLLNLIRLKL